MDKRLLEIMLVHGPEIMDMTLRRLGIDKSQKSENMEEMIKQIAKTQLLSKTMEMCCNHAAILDHEEIMEVIRAACDATDLLASKIKEVTKEDK